MSEHEPKLNQEDIENKLLPVLIEAIEEELQEEELLTDLEIRRARANKTILAFVASAGATAVLPIPLADAPLLCAEQTAMLLKLTDIYGINLKKNALRSMVFTVLGISGTTLIGKTITGSLLKLIPGAGWAAGAAINGSTASLLTGALGKAYSELCEAVLAGEIKEQELLELKGRLMLETTFRNYLRLGMEEDPNAKKDKEDVLKINEKPNPEKPILMPMQDAEQAAETEPDKDENEYLPAKTPETLLPSTDEKTEDESDSDQPENKE